MNKQPGTSKPNTDTSFTHSCPKIPRLEQDVQTESDGEDYLITIKEEEPCEESIIIENTPIPTFKTYENNDLITIKEDEPCEESIIIESTSIPTFTTYENNDLITIKKEEPCEESITIEENTPLRIFTTHENNVKVEQCLENNALLTMTTFNFTMSKTWLMQRSINPMDYLNHFLDKKFLNSIVKATNHEAHLCQMLGFRNRPDWKDVTVGEFKIFIGLLLHTGTAKMNTLAEYWKTHRLSKSCFPDYMALARFTAILQYLAIAEQESVDHFNGVMNRNYVPGRNLQLNVSGIDTFNNSFTPDVNKTGALGIDIFILFEQGGPILKIATDVKACSTSDKETLFLTLLEGKLDCGHSLYVAPKLTIPVSIAILLLNRNTYCNGILQPELNEHCPKVDDSVYLEKVHTDPYIDTIGKDVYYISTQFKGTPGSGTKQAPQAIRHYLEKSKSNEFQDIRSYYPFGVTNFSQRNKVFIFVLMASIRNASIAAGIDFNDYRWNIIENLLPESKQCKEKSKHRLTRIPWCGGDSSQVVRNDVSNARLDCYNCAMAKNVSRVTVYCCNECKDSPPLCVECFFDVHVED